jgi:hypothetical protein
VIFQFNAAQNEDELGPVVDARPRLPARTAKELNVRTFESKKSTDGLG